VKCELCRKYGPNHWGACATDYSIIERERRELKAKVLEQLKWKVLEQLKSNVFPKLVIPRDFLFDEPSLPPAPSAPRTDHQTGVASARARW
jgi:hypothetical protein